MYKTIDEIPGDLQWLATHEHQWRDQIPNYINPSSTKLVIYRLDDSVRYCEVNSMDFKANTCYTRAQWQAARHVTFKAEPTHDSVNHPEHYTSGEIECIDAIRAALTPDEFRGFCKGNMIKYVWRERIKGGDESIKKAIWYANTAIESNKQ